MIFAERAIWSSQNEQKLSLLHERIHLIGNREYTQTGSILCIVDGKNALQSQ